VRLPRFFTPALLIALLGPTVPVQGAPYLRLDSQNQIRQDLLGNTQLPWLNRFQLILPDSDHRAELNLDGQFEADPLSDSFDGGLYRASVVWGHPKYGLTFEGGRFLLNQGFGMIPLDGAQVTWSGKTRVSLRTYGGIRRQYEVRNFSHGSALVGGAVTVDPISFTSITAGYRFEDDLAGIRRQSAIGSIRQAFPLLWEPVLLGSIDYQLGNKTIGTAQGGLELHPLDRVNLLGEIARYDESNDGFRFENRVFLLFARTPQWLERGTASIEAAKLLTFYGSYSRQSYDVVPGIRELGHMSTVGGRFGSETSRTSGDGSLFYENSYGGRVFGGIAALRERIFTAWLATATFAVGKYDKITGSSDYALHAGLALSRAFKSGIELGLGSEFNSNVDQPKDFRAGVFARYRSL
jgi:hypothetical protein